ncbi:MAG TPA: hypothetical protein VIU61_20805 [Kofleriaceae bacterium]
MSVRLRVPDVDDPSFVADVSFTEGAVLRLTGSADSSVTLPLGKLLADLHEELSAKQVREVVVDMTAVDFMSSPCVKSFLTWIEKLQELAPEGRYRIRMRSNPAILWQKHGLQALSCFDTDLVKVES